MFDFAASLGFSHLYGLWPYYSYGSYIIMSLVILFKHRTTLTLHHKDGIDTCSFCTGTLCVLSIGASHNLPWSFYYCWVVRVAEWADQFIISELLVNSPPIHIHTLMTVAKDTAAYGPEWGWSHRPRGCGTTSLPQIPRSRRHDSIGNTR